MAKNVIEVKVKLKVSMGAALLGILLLGVPGIHRAQPNGLSQHIGNAA